MPRRMPEGEGDVRGKSKNSRIGSEEKGPGHRKSNSQKVRQHDGRGSILEDNVNAIR